MVYTSATASLAVLEHLVHVTMDQGPHDLVLIAVDAPEALQLTAVDVASLPDDWRTYPAPESLADIGSSWARQLRTAILKVPSALVPHESNYLLNPLHPQFGEVIPGTPQPFTLDARLRKPASIRR